MSVRTTEVSRIRSPIKRQIRHLDGGSKRKFPELLRKVVEELREKEYKLTHVTKSYRKDGNICSDSFWKKETRVKNIKIVWMTTLTIVFDSGFSFRFDFDFWFKFTKFLQNLRSEIYQSGFPRTTRSYAEKFGKNEASRILEEVRKTIGKEIKSEVGGWGEHGIKKEVTDRKSVDICHREKIEIDSIAELDSLRECLDDIGEEPVEVVENSRGDIDKTAQDTLDEMIPFQIDPDSLEGYLAFFICFRDPGGGFEYQLYRFIQENYERIVRKEEIRDSLMKLEVHGYINVKETPRDLVEKLEDKRVHRCRRFYESGEEKIPKRRLFDELERKTKIGAYLAPLSREKLVDKINAPKHLANKKVKKLIRKNTLSRRKVKDYAGRTVQKLKPQRNPENFSGLERNIMKEAETFYNIQKDSLDQVQEARPRRPQ